MKKEPIIIIEPDESLLSKLFNIVYKASLVLFIAVGATICTFITLLMLSYPQETINTVKVVYQVYTNTVPGIQAPPPTFVASDMTYFPADIALKANIRSNLQTRWNAEKKTRLQNGDQFSTAVPSALFLMIYNPETDSVGLNQYTNLDCGCPSGAGTIDVDIVSLDLSNELNVISYTSIQRVLINGFPQTPNHRLHMPEGDTHDQALANAP